MLLLLGLWLGLGLGDEEEVGVVLWELRAVRGLR
jgi:hypothetical protein